MALAIKPISSNTSGNSSSTITLYTVPAGRVAKVVISNLYTDSITSNTTNLTVGNFDFSVGFVLSSERVFYIGPGQTVTVVRVNSSSVTTRCTVQFAAIEETAS